MFSKHVVYNIINLQLTFRLRQIVGVGYVNAIHEVQKTCHELINIFCALQQCINVYYTLYIQQLHYFTLRRSRRTCVGVTTALV